MRSSISMAKWLRALRLFAFRFIQSSLPHRPGSASLCDLRVFPVQMPTISTFDAGHSMFDIFSPTFLHPCNLAAVSFPLIHFFLFPIKNLKSSIGNRQCTPTSHGLHPHITRRSKRPSPKPILVIRDWSQSKCAADKAEYNITMDEKASGWLRRVELLSTRVE